MPKVATAVFLLLIACAAERPSPVPSPVRDCAGVCGRVVDGSGKAITRFSAVLFSVEPGRQWQQFALPEGYPPMPGPVIATAEGRPDGSFNLDPHGATRVVLGISARGFRVHQTAPFEPGAGRPGVVTLIASRKIALQLKDERGRPVAGAKIVFDSPRRPFDEALRAAAQAEPLARTDAAGRAWLDEPYPQRNAILIIDDRHVPARLTYARDAVSLELVLHDGVALRGRARTPDGTPVAHPALEARCEGWPPFQTGGRDDGTFVFERLPRVRCDVVAGRGFMNDDEQHAVVVMPMHGTAQVDLRQEASAIDIVIPSSGLVSGKLTGLERMSNGYAAFARSGSTVVRMSTGYDGTFWQRLAPGAWKIEGVLDEEGTHLETDRVAVQVVDGKDAHVELPFPNPTTIRVKVQDRMPASEELTIEPHDPAVRTRGRVHTSRPGVWTISGLQRGMYTASLQQGSWRIALDVEVPSVREINLPLYTAELDVSDAAGRPISADVRVVQSVFSADGFSIKNAGEQAPALGVAGDGKHVAWEMPAGTYTVAIKAAGYKDAAATVVVPGVAPHVVLQTIDRPWPRAPKPPVLDASRLAVLPAVIADLDARARAVWSTIGETRRGRLVVADQTVRRPSTITMWVGRENEGKYASLQRLKSGPLFDMFDRDQSVHTIPLQSASGVLMVSFDALPLRPPQEWGEASTEAELFDVAAIRARWPKAACFVLLSTPQIAPDGTEALVSAWTTAGDHAETYLYRLARRKGRWVVKESWQIATEPGC